MKLRRKIIGIIAGAIVILFLIACYLLMFKPWLFMGYAPEDKYIMKEPSEIIGFDSAILYEKKGLLEVEKW